MIFTEYFFCKQDNLVGTVVVISLLIWIPISCLISWVDRQRAERDQKVCLLIKTILEPYLQILFFKIFFYEFFRNGNGEDKTN